ncbi:MAG: DUF3568 family protein [Planctomycetota bacterium]
MPAGHLRAVALAVLALVPAGCVPAALAVGAAATYGIISYSRNEAYQDFDAGLDRCWAASVAAARDQGWEVPDDPRPGTTEGTLKAGELRVVVERHAGGFTRVRVRVGTFEQEDNKRKAKLLLEAIAGRVDA